jgi:hypothetical protein
MSPAGFEPATPASEQPHTHALDRATTGVCSVYVSKTNGENPSLLYPNVASQSYSYVYVHLVAVITRKGLSL